MTLLRFRMMILLQTLIVTIQLSSISAFHIGHYSHLHSHNYRSQISRGMVGDNNSGSDKVAAKTFTEPGRNPNKPELPELKGDFDWDAKFSGDDDWITENVPGKIVLSDLEIANQVTKLTQLEEKWRKERQKKEYDSARLLGWTEQAEAYNGRYAMFFLVVGLLTEYWTGFSMPAQVEEMLRVGGIIGFEG
jgi:hypothetical protein